MKLLLYCILNITNSKTIKPLIGINNQPIFYITEGGLSAVVSESEDSPLSVNLQALLSYKEVIETLHFEHTVVPMRYGAIFQNQSRVIDFLKEHSDKYKLLLNNLVECVEMGIKVILKTANKSQKLSEELNQPNSPGFTYLIAQKKYYETKDSMDFGQKAILQKVCDTLSGLYIQTTHDYYPLANGQLLSLYFLVPKNMIALFRQKFHSINIENTNKLLLSGPWPPYNFVCTNHTCRNQ